MVDIPDGVEEIVVEDGYCYPNISVLHNGYKKESYVSIVGQNNKKIVIANGTTTTYPMDGEQELTHESFGSIMNTLFNSRSSFDIRTGVVVDSSIIPNSFHIGFRLKLIKPFVANTITLMDDSVHKIILFNGKLIRINGSNRGYNRVDMRDSWLNFDINFNNGQCETYVNGKRLSDGDVSPIYNPEEIIFNGDCTLCKCTTDIYRMADFEITDVLTEEEIINKKYNELIEGSEKRTVKELMAEKIEEIKEYNETNNIMNINKTFQIGFNYII